MGLLEACPKKASDRTQDGCVEGVACVEGVRWPTAGRGYRHELRPRLAVDQSGIGLLTIG